MNDVKHTRFGSRSKKRSLNQKFMPNNCTGCYHLISTIFMIYIIKNKKLLEISYFNLEKRKMK